MRAAPRRLSSGRALVVAGALLTAATGVAVASAGGEPAPADDPDRPTGAVHLRAAPVREHDGRARITVRREPGAIARIAWRTRAGTAAAPADFEASSGVVQFRTGQHERVIEVPVHADRRAEGPETFDVVAGALPGHATPPPIAITTVVLGD